MIRFFRNSYLIQYLLLLLMAVLLWLPSFVELPANEVVQPSGVTPLYDFIVSWLSSKPFLLQIIAFLLFVTEAYAFNEIMIVGKIEPKVSSVGIFVFIMLMGLTPVQTSFLPTLLATAFVLPVIYVLYRMPVQQRVEIDLLNVGFCLAFATMSYFYSVLLLVWVMVALAIQKPKTARLQLIPVIGFLLPYFFYFAIHFIKGDIVGVLDAYSVFFAHLAIGFEAFDIMSIVALVLLALVAFLPLNESSLFEQERHVDVRQNVTMASLLFFVSLVMVLFSNSLFVCGLSFLALSVHNTFSLNHVVKTRWTEFVFDIIVLAVYVLHYLPLFR